MPPAFHLPWNGKRGGEGEIKNKIKAETVFLKIELVSHHVLIQFLSVNVSDPFIPLQETLQSFHKENFIFSHSDTTQEIISVFCESFCFLSTAELHCSFVKKYHIGKDDFKLSVLYLIKLFWKRALDFHQPSCLQFIRIYTDCLLSTASHT